MYWLFLFVIEVPVKKSNIPSPNLELEKLDNPFGGVGGGELFRSYILISFSTWAILKVWFYIGHK